ncbi:TPA: hypothetical protein DEP96_00500 [Candidatus Uhrbacteria bacterium]|nr:hypothetical protein [Candidatus Uhrbacteria bacterium]
MTVRLLETNPRPAVRYKFSRVFKVAVIFLVIAGVGIMSILISFWYFHVHRGFGGTLAQVIPVPAAIVDGHVVWYSEVVRNAGALEAEAGLTSDEAMHRGLWLAERYEVTRAIGSTLGVTANTDRLVYDTAVEQALLTSAKYQGEARSRIERLQAKLTQGVQFKDLATQYSEGASASVGGDLGYVDPADLPPDLSSVAAVMLPGTVSTITETRTSFWLMQCLDVIAPSDSPIAGGESSTRVWLRVIEIKKDLLGPIIDRAMLTANIKEFGR